MLAAVRLVTALFIFFLATPTVVSVIKKTSDTSCFFNMTEEEIVHKSFNEVKAQFPDVVQLTFGFFSASAETPMFWHTADAYCAISSPILSPPPEFI